MRWSVSGGEAYSILKVELSPGESVTAEPGAMMAVRGDVRVHTRSGGFLKGLLRKLAGGESFFLNTFEAGTGGGEVWLAPPVPGSIEAIELRGEEWVVQDASYLAHHGDVDVGVAWRGFKGLLAEGELVWLKVSGRGIVWVNAYGSIERVSIPAGESAIIDNFHFVAMPARARYRVRKFGGIKTFLFGGEGVVVEVEGPAEVLVQTRTLPELVRLLYRYLPRR